MDAGALGFKMAFLFWFARFRRWAPQPAALPCCSSASRIIESRRPTIDLSASGIGHCFGAISAPCALRGLCFASRLRFAVPQRISRRSAKALAEILRTHRKKRPLGLGAEPLASGAPIHRAERI